MTLCINNIGYSRPRYRTNGITIDNIPTVLFFSSNYTYYADPFYELEVE